MAKTLNRVWTKSEERRLLKAKEEGQVYESTVTSRLAIQYLILLMDKNNIPFKLYRLGAGVTKITTDTSVCPCCKKHLKGE